MKTFILVLRCAFGGLLGLIFTYASLSQSVNVIGHFIRSEWSHERTLGGMVIASIFGILGFYAIREAITVAKRIRPEKQISG